MWANNSTGNTPTPIRIKELILIQSLPTWFQYVKWFSAQKTLSEAMNSNYCNILICLLDHALNQIPSANDKKEHQRWPEKPLILGRSGTQYVDMVTKSLSVWNTFSEILLQSMKHFWYKLAEILYLFSSYLNKILLSVWHHQLTNLHILKTWTSLNEKRYLKTVNSIFLLMKSTCLCFKIA